jgi:tRNA nucleotidyltransferase (CCA-adding enzyme)
MRRHLLPRSGRSLAKSTLKRRLGRRRLELVERIGEVAAQQGWATYLVGGVVRDLLLGRATKDLDLVVVGNAPEVAALVARSEAGQLREHRAFGTASIEFEDGLRVDLATARRESYARPAALPRTIASGMVDDLLRRDFTINSLALDLSSSCFGEIMDPGRGRADVRRGLIRVLHERSFLDDPTRIFRALRFANRLGFEIETSTAALMHSASASGVVDRLSAARVRRELRMIFDEPGWAGAAGALSDYDLWTAVEPSLGGGRGSAGRVERAESWAEWYAATEGAESVSRWVLALAALAHGGARDERKRVVRRLRPGRQDATDLIDAPGRAREILRELRAARHPRPSRVFRICEGASVITCLVALSDTRAGAVRHAICGYLRRFSSFEADISGDDLLREGVPAGPLVGIGLRAALEAKLDGRASDASRQLAVAIRATRSRA